MQLATRWGAADGGRLRCRDGARALLAPAYADLPRERTEQWARAIYEDQSAGEKVEELRYRTACYGRTSLVLRDGPEVVAGPAMRPDSPGSFRWRTMLSAFGC